MHVDQYQSMMNVVNVVVMVLQMVPVTVMVMLKTVPVFAVDQL